ncbi:hypothetical protein ACS0TY_009823 [Phlomoides rotata]
MKNKINSLVELNTEKAEEFLEGLLADGWLLHLVNASGCLEKPIAKWTFNSMLYSSKVWLMEAACEFWRAVLSIRDEVDFLSPRSPGYTLLPQTFGHPGLSSTDGDGVVSELSQFGAGSASGTHPDIQVKLIEHQIEFLQRQLQASSFCKHQAVRQKQKQGHLISRGNQYHHHHHHHPSLTLVRPTNGSLQKYPVERVKSMEAGFKNCDVHQFIILKNDT